jgi:hypothetical protein
LKLFISSALTAAQNLNGPEIHIQLIISLQFLDSFTVLIKEYKVAISTFQAFSVVKEQSDFTLYR